MGSAQDEVVLDDEITFGSLTGTPPRKKAPSDWAGADADTGAASSTTNSGGGDGGSSSEDLGTGKRRCATTAASSIHTASDAPVSR